MERSIHVAVDDAGLEAGVRVAERDGGGHDALAEVWCTYSGVVCCEISAGLQPGCLRRRLAGLSAPTWQLYYYKNPLLYASAEDTSSVCPLFIVLTL